MLSWLFKKRGPVPAPAAPAPGSKPTQAQAKAPAAAPAPAPAVDEGPLLRAALGDDAALLRLAQSASLLATKLAAVEALNGEAALRQAERSFRSHDRKVHRLAKQRLEAAVTRREAQAQAQALLERTRGLVAEALVPVNHVVEVDRAWAALPAQALPPEVQQAWAALRAELDTRMRDEEEAQRRLQRWVAEARQRLESAPLDQAAAAAGAGTPEAAQAAAQLAAALAALNDTRPDVPATATLGAALARAQEAATELQARLEQSAQAAAAKAAEAEAARAQAAQAEAGQDAAAEAGAAPEAASAPAPASEQTPQDENRLAARRQRLESLLQQAEAALSEGQLAVLQQRLQAIENTLAQAHAAPPEAWRARLQALQAERGRLKAWQQWGSARARDELMAEAEALALQTLAAAPPGPAAPVTPAEALAPVATSAVPVAAENTPVPGAAAGVEATAEPQPADEAPATEPAPDAGPAHEPDAADTFDQTDAPAHADARAEADARGPADETPQATQSGDATAAAEPPPAPDASARSRRAKTPRPPPPLKLNLKQHADAIQSLRRRWKALDHQGAVASAEQWRRFDAALQVAHEPVAAQQAALKAARLENLAARETLLAAFEAWPAAAAPASAAAPAAPAELADAQPAPAAADGPPPTPPQDGAAATLALDWRACSAELDRFNAAWRKLGPVEHTVPAAARDALLQRLNAALARIEGPLRQARATAAAEREQLIAQAERLLPSAGDRPGAETTRQLRELQAAWQEHARSLPLPRGLETALWTRFKAATDAVFAQREAAFAARDAELAANLAAAQVLVDRLAALDITLPPAEIQRTLAEIDRAWRQGGELPRGAVEPLEARFHAARSAAAELLNAGQQQRWQARCDALAVRLALCEAREDAAAAGDPAHAAPAADETRPAVNPADTVAATDAVAEPDTLPAAWQQALAQRRAQPLAAGPLARAEVDDLLLRLEAALNLPSAPAWQAARQQLKLRALKDTMEGRTPVQAGPQQHGSWLVALLRQAGLDAAQRARLQALLAALRAAPPALLGLPDR